MENAEVKTVGVIATTVASTAEVGSITVATVTTSAPGILGASALLGYGVYKGFKIASKK